MKADTAVMRIIKGLRIVLVRTDVFGAFVNQEWRERFAGGSASRCYVRNHPCSFMRRISKSCTTTNA